MSNQEKLEAVKFVSQLLKDNKFWEENNFNTAIDKEYRVLAARQLDALEIQEEV